MEDLALTHVADLLSLQSGVVSRRQCLSRGVSANDLRRLLRRRSIALVHPGVYVTHTGPLTWLQRAWAAVLACAPAALCRESAKRAADGPGRASFDPAGPIHVAVSRNRKLIQPEGVVLHRSTHLGSTTLWNASPPRQRIEYATLELAGDAEREVDAVAFLADALRSRQTTAERLADALAIRERFPRRDFLRAVISDVATGTCSSLEHGYLSRVERPHGLPTARRQFRESIKGSLYRDAYYEDYDAVVELDGRLHHTSVAARDRDLERDLDTFATARATARLGWGQVFDRACATATKVGAGLKARGWQGAVRRCPQCPPAAEPGLCG